MAIQLIKNQESGSKSKALLNDNSHTSIHPDLQTSKLAPTLTLPRREGKKAAFTLAEVLITLGIIGVVAALTLPTLIQNYKKKEVETKLARVYSVMNQALNLSKVEYGDFSGWSDYIACGSVQAHGCENAIEIFNKYIGNNLKYLKIEKDTVVNENSNDYFFNLYFNDGSILQVHSGLRDMSLYIDKKAAHTNQKRGVNQFNFRFVIKQHFQTENDTRDQYNVGKGFEPYLWGWDGTEEGLFEGLYGCAKSTINTPGGYCTKIIQNNGWKIPDNYPYKF